MAATLTPRTEGEWAQWKPIFTELYIDQNKPLGQVMRIMEEEHGVKASVKMYKNKVKEWGLSKYLKADQAQQILDSVGPILDSQDDAVRRARKSLKRKRARERAQSQASPAQDLTQKLPSITPEFCEEPESYTQDKLVSPTSAGVHSPSIPRTWLRPDSSGGIHPTTPPLSATANQFLHCLRRWTYDAFMSGQWDAKANSQHQNGRRASRAWASDLTAGAALFKKGHGPLAWKYWSLALASFENKDLLNTWYYETPIRILFEMGRLVHEGHARFVSILLRSVKDWAKQFLDSDDSRRALYTVFGDLQPSELRDLYDHAAKSLYQGLASRIDKKNPLLYEIRLNRALDLLWYDPNADLSEWVPSIEEVDESCGPNNPYSVYFLLLEAYRLVAQDSYEKAEDVCQQVVKRLDAMKDESTVDPWRVGLAYRRLGRVQQARKRYLDAMVSLNTALRYVKSGENRNSGSIQIEICQDLEQISMMLNDVADAALWRQQLEELEKQVAQQEEEERKRLDKVCDDSLALNNGFGSNGTGNIQQIQQYGISMLPQDYGMEQNVKRIKRNIQSRSASPGSPSMEFNSSTPNKSLAVHLS